MGAKDAWFSPTVRVGDEYEINPEKSGRESFAERLSRIARAGLLQSVGDTR